jgi:hypothetical protein
MLWSKVQQSMFSRVTVWVLVFSLCGVSSVRAEKQLSLDVDLEGPAAAAQWVLQSHGGVSVGGGELVLDTVKRKGVRVFLRTPTLCDLTLTCKIFVESKGAGVRAFEVCFHSVGIASHQFVHVNRGSAILNWARRENGWNELARVACTRKEGKWLDVKVQCVDEQIRFYLDGKLVLSKTDSHWQAGRIGFGSSQGLVRVKDIHLEGTSVTLEQPWRTDVPKLFGTFHQLASKRRHTEVSEKLDISVSDPFIISSRITNPELGTHEQPHLFKLPGGDLLLVFHKDGDIHGAQRVILRSSDQGKTWTPMPTPVHRPESMAVLRDGTVIIYDDYAFRKEGNEFVGEMSISRNGGKSFGPLELAVFQRPDNCRARDASTYWPAKEMDLYRKTSAKWSTDLCHALWRTVLEKDDGTLIACAATGYEGDKQPRTVCYQSTDKGRTWHSESVVAGGSDRYAHEPVMSFCSNGDVLCIMRRDLMQARSTDGGKTWKFEKDLAGIGVDPDLCLMTNGVLACSYGRPGNRIMFSVDGTGREWTDQLQIYEYQRGSFGYTGIVEVQPGKLLFVYDHHDAFAEYGGKQTTAVQGVYITVKKR